jgi:hypothetical protein
VPKATRGRFICGIPITVAWQRNLWRPGRLVRHQIRKSEPLALHSRTDRAPSTKRLPPNSDSDASLCKLSSRRIRLYDLDISLAKLKRRMDSHASREDESIYGWLLRTGANLFLGWTKHTSDQYWWKAPVPSRCNADSISIGTPENHAASYSK